MGRPIIRIFIALQMCCSGDDCCLAPGQTQKEIDDLTEAVKNGAQDELEINEIRNVSVAAKFPAVMELFKKYDYNALPIIMVDNEIVSYGISDKEFIINSINKGKKND